MNGKEVIRQFISDMETTIETGNLSSGIYLLHYTDGDKTSNFQVVKF